MKGTKAQPSRIAAIYVRVSSSVQEDGSSLETQEAACRRYATEQGYVLDEAHVYREVHTGTELWERPKLVRLREAVRRHEVAAVGAYAIDRLSRDPVHLGVIVSEADHADVDVLFVTEPLDNSPEGQLIRFVRGYAAKVEHEKIRERSIRGKRARVQSGKLLPGCKPLYGYRWRDAGKTAYEIDPATASVVQRIYRDYARGVPLARIAIELTADGIPKPTNRGYPRWSHPTIHHILTTPAYAGIAISWRRSAARGKNRPAGRWQPEEAQITLPADAVPAIVDLEIFETVQQRRALNNRSYAVARSSAGQARSGGGGESP